MHFKCEFHEETQEFIEEAAREWLQTHRAPFIDKKRTDKVHGTVLDHLMLPNDVHLDLDATYDSDTFSQSENESDMDIMG